MNEKGKEFYTVIQNLNYTEKVQSKDFDWLYEYGMRISEFPNKELGMKYAKLIEFYKHKRSNDAYTIIFKDQIEAKHRWF